MIGFAGCMKVENRTTVFYVDDNEKSSRLLTSVLEASGFRVIAEHDPVDAKTGSPQGIMLQDR